MEPYSVLMSVYAKDRPEFLRQSINSMLEQSCPSDDFVLVCDGPLYPQLDAVVERFAADNAGLFTVVRLKENLGIGGAAQAGLSRCRHDLVAKMDADDVAVPTRCEAQLGAFAANPELDICGGQLAEFAEDISNVQAVRQVPTAHEDILRFARRRSPFNNQTVMYRKAAVTQCGGYDPAMRRCEDYDLYLRMLQGRCRAANIAEVLVYFRLDDEAYQRRGSWANLKGFFTVHWRKHRRGFASLADFIIPCAGQLVFTAMPGKLRDLFYKKLLR